MAKTDRLIFESKNIFEGIAGEMISPEQCRAARAWLNWSQARLARAASVNVGIVRDFELGRRAPTPEIGKELQAALEKSGISFVSGTKSLGIVVETS